MDEDLRGRPFCEGDMGRGDEEEAVDADDGEGAEAELEGVMIESGRLGVLDPPKPLVWA